MESSSKKDQRKKELTSNVNEKAEEKSQDGKAADQLSESSAEMDKRQPHINQATEETSFTGSSNELSSDTLGEPVSTESEEEKKRADQTQRSVYMRCHF